MGRGYRTHHWITSLSVAALLITNVSSSKVLIQFFGQNLAKFPTWKCFFFLSCILIVLPHNFATVHKWCKKSYSVTKCGHSMADKVMVRCTEKYMQKPIQPIFMWGEYVKINIKSTQLLSSKLKTYIPLRIITLHNPFKTLIVQSWKKKHNSLKLHED